MAEQELMGFNKVNGRWYKRYKTKQYCVTAGKLSKLYPELVTGESQSGTRRAANAWWLAKQEEIDAHPPALPVDPDQGQKDRLSEIGQHFRSKEEFETARKVEGKIEDIENWRKWYGPTELPNEILESVAVEEAEMLRDRIYSKATTGLDCASNAKAWLDHKQKSVTLGKLSAGHWDNLRRELQEFLDWFGADRSIKDITGKDYLGWHDNLVERVTEKKLSEPAAKRLQGTAKSWIQWLYDVEAIDAVPRNFSDKKLNWEVAAKQVDGWSKSDVKFALANAGEPLKLYLLLMLNCGFTQIDVAELSKSEIDFKKKTITRARSKTRDRSDNVPTVTWPLWKQTADLLSKHLSKDAVLALTNEDGKPLKTEKIRGKDEARAGSYAKIDNIASSYYRLQRKFSDQKWRQLKELRKTGASMFRSNPQFTSIRELFLGHTDKSIADKNYAGAPMQLLADAVQWLGKELGIDK